MPQASPHLRSALDAAVDGVTRHTWLLEALTACGPALRTTCRAVTSSAEEADELLQETLLRALTHPPVDRTSSLLPWLRTVARRLVIDRRRVRTPEAASPLVDAATDDGAPIDVDVGTREAVEQALVGAVAQLSAAQLAVFLLQTFLGLSADEVAAAVDLSPGNVRVLGHRARTALAGASPLSEAARRRAVAEFFRDVCQGRITGLAELLGHTRGDGVAPAGELGATLRGPAGRKAWERLVTAAGAVVRDGDDEAAAMAAWTRAAALEEAGDLVGSLAAYRSALAASQSRGLDALASRTLLAIARQSLLQTGVGPEPAPTEVVDAGDPLRHATFDGGRLWRQGDYAAAAAVYRTALDTAEGADRGAVLHNLALVGALSGALDEARSRALEALALHRAAGNTQAEGRTLNALGMVAQNAGALTEAEGWFTEALGVLSRSQWPSDGAATRTNLGLLAHERGDWARAEAWFLEAARQAHGVGVVRSEGIALANLGVTLHTSGRVRPALRAFGEARRLLLGGGFGLVEAFVDAHEAAALAHTELPAAHTRLARARAAVERLGDAGMAELLGLVAAWLGCRGDWAAGAPALEARLAELGRPVGDAPPWLRRSVVVRIGAETVRRLALGVAPPSQ
jgi:RNA polymerase sigma-70 factor (ECF subfamily)